MTNPTTPASGDELSDVRLLELAAETDLARDYDGSGYVESTCREGADITASVLAFARAAIAADRAARQAPVVPAGWRLVPMEPTLDMGWAYLKAAEKSSLNAAHVFSHSGYRAMLSAAPAAPLQQAQDGERLADRIVRDVSELSDRESPEDWPEAMLVTADELRAIILAVLREE